MIRRIKDHLRNEYQLNILKKEAEFNSLQSQINPHFLYNTLESISVLAEMKKGKEVSKSCRILSNMFRYSIGTKLHTVTIKKELDHLDDYISIIKLRFEDTIKFQIEADPALYPFEILKLTLQPLVENAINHGLSEMPSGGLVCVKIYLKENYIYIEVWDNGKGISFDKQDELSEMLESAKNSNSMDAWTDNNSSIGLRNIHFRLVFYYGLNFGIVGIASTPGNGTRITLKIPAKKMRQGMSHD
jgi:two-component system, sensor histidine kinase YesM